MRNSMDRVSCSNNLRQIGIAVELYYQAWDMFPPGGGEFAPSICLRIHHSSKYRQLAWSALILDYFESNGVNTLLNIDRAFDSPANTTASAIVLSIFLYLPRRQHPNMAQQWASH